MESPDQFYYDSINVYVQSRRIHRHVSNDAIAITNHTDIGVNLSSPIGKIQWQKSC